MAARAGVEPANVGFRVPCLTTWLPGKVLICLYILTKDGNLHNCDIPPAIYTGYMTAQHIFYILGSITFGAFILFLIGAVAILMTIAGQIRKISHRIHLLTEEVHGIIESGKNYGKTMGSIGILTRIIRAFRNKSN